MKSLLFAFLTVFITTACSLGTGNDSPYPMKIGTWQVNSETDAEWIGESDVSSNRSKAKADTIVFTSPDNTYLEISHGGGVESTTEIRINILYVDSTITKEFGEQHGLNLERTFIDFEGAEIGPKPYRLNKRYSDVNNGIHEAHMQFLYTCNNNADDIEVANINLLYDAETYPGFWEEEFAEFVYQTTSLDITGFKDVLESEFCTD